MAYVAGLEAEPIEWLLVFYMAKDMRLIAVESAESGDAGFCPVDHAKIAATGSGGLRNGSQPPERDATTEQG